jgi:holo-[acyl-carrier protein] synthase
VPSVGVDGLEIARLERALSRRPKLAERLFTSGEREFAAARARPARHLAARFCAKEAVAKALELKIWSPLDVEVIGGGDEPPRVRLAGSAAHRAAALQAEVKVSLTHDRSGAAAVALVA